MKIIIPLAFVLFSGTQAFCQKKLNLIDSVSYLAGYENIITIDSFRTYKPGTSVNEALHYRPIELDLWYPARFPGSGAPIKYGEFLHLLEQRSNRFQNDTIFKTINAELIQYISSNLNIRDTTAISEYKTSSWLHAEHVPGRFPLIIYMSSYNGMSYENINLFEFLAAHGYVVACITSAGRYPGNMSTKKEDLLEQVEDGAFAMRQLENRIDIDSNRIGTLGYSWGGLAALILSQRQKGIKADLSLDGSEMHHYGESADEDKDFDSIRYAFLNSGVKYHTTYAYLASGAANEDQLVDSVFDIFLYTGYPKKYTYFPNAKHESFSCLPFMTGEISHDKNISTDLYHSFCQLSLDFFNQFLKNDDNSFSNRLALVYISHQGDSIYPTTYSKRNEILIRGKITEEGSREPLAYVNIGIPDKNMGTVSSRDGSFEIRIDSLALVDSLKISMIGYQSRSVPLLEILKGRRPLIIALHQKQTPLQEVVVTQKKIETRTLGNKTTSTFVSVGLPLKFLGSETGVRINLGKKPVLLKSFSFNVSGTRLDTATFRLNIYRFKNGAPQENMLQKNILVSVGKRTGKYTVALNDYKLLLKDDILISLEWIEGSVSGSTNGALYLSAAFLNSATWHRLTSQAQWKKATGLGVGFNVDVQKILTK